MVCGEWGQVIQSLCAIFGRAHDIITHSSSFLAMWWHTRRPPSQNPFTSSRRRRHPDEYRGLLQKGGSFIERGWALNPFAKALQHFHIFSPFRKKGFRASKKKVNTDSGARVLFFFRRKEGGGIWRNGLTNSTTVRKKWRKCVNCGVFYLRKCGLF